MDGDVTTGIIGFDAEWDRALAGVMLSQSTGEGSYRLDPAQGDDAGTVESDLTGVYPYARIDLNERVSAWGLAGAGSGTITLKRDAGKAMKTDLSMRMGALGVVARKPSREETQSMCGVNQAQRFADDRRETRKAKRG